MKHKISNLCLPKPQRLYSRLRAFPWRLSIENDEIRDVLAVYGLDLINRPKPASAGGTRNKNVIINTSAGKKLLKRYKESLDQSTIVQEHSILKYLAQIDFPAARLETAQTGETLVQKGSNRYALFEFINKGFRSYDYMVFPGQSLKYIAAAGKMLGILHDKLRNFDPQGYNPDGFKSKTGDRWRNDAWFIDRLKFCVAKTVAEHENRTEQKSIRLLERVQEFEDTILHNGNMLKSAHLPRQIIHKDYGPSNLLFRKNGSPIVLDFEIARLDWKVVDVIDGWEGFCLKRSGYSSAKMKCFVDAYQTHMSLTADEFKFIPVIWKLLKVRSCIRSWYSYSLTGKKDSLLMVHKNIRDFDWLTANQEKIMAEIT